MKKKLYFIIISLSTLFFLMVMYQCKKDDDTDIGPQLTNLATDVIGPEGGIIEINDISITIPEGALTNDININIYEAVNDDGISIENQITEALRIEGIPEDIAHPVEIQFKAPDEYEGDICLNVAIIGKTEANTDTLLVSFDPFVCQVSDGLVTGTLPLYENLFSDFKASGEDVLVEFFS